MNPELITKLTELIVTIIVLLVSAYLVPWLKNKIGEDKYALLIEFAEIIVRSAEKIYTPEQWETKKQYAVTMVTDKAHELGIEITLEEVNAIVEGAVQAVKG